MSHRTLVAMRIDEYAAFIHASADDVVEQALAYVFAKDRDLQVIVKSRDALQVASTLRLRKAPAIEAAEPSANKRASGCLTRGSCSGIEGMIRPPYPRRDQNGASHRKNVDTPSLKGLCLQPNWFRLGFRRNDRTWILDLVFTVPSGTAVKSLHGGSRNAYRLHCN